MNNNLKDKFSKENLQDFYENLTKEKVLNYLFIISSAVLFIVGVFTIILGVNSAKKMRVEIATLQEQVSQKTTDIENLNLTPEEQEYVQETLNSALIDGNEITDLQNSLKKKQDYWDTGAIADIESSIEDYLGPNDKAAKTSWYYVPADQKKNWEWKFETTYQFRGESIPCLWICYEKDTDTILAYATAVYTPGNPHGVFTDVVVEMTAIGLSYTGYVEPEETTPTDATNPTDGETTTPTDADGNPVDDKDKDDTKPSGETSSPAPDEPVDDSGSPNVDYEPGLIDPT